MLHCKNIAMPLLFLIENGPIAGSTKIALPFTAATHQREYSSTKLDS